MRHGSDGGRDRVPDEPPWLADSPAADAPYGAAWRSGMPSPAAAADRYTDAQGGW